MARIDSFLRVVVEQRASDLHMSSGSVPAVRRDGELVPLPFRALSDAEARRFLFEILTPEQREVFEAEQALDFVYAIEGLARFRGNLFAHALGVGSVFRIIPSRPPYIDELSLPPIARSLTELKEGLVLLCGPTGAGKTTTVAAMVNEINERDVRHVIVIEDPIEFVHDSKRSVISQRQVGVHARDYTQVVKAALRESPDVLVVGEMRGHETLDLALSAAEAGMLVIGTLHASSAAKAVHRIVDSFPEERRAEVLVILARQFRGILAQHLLRSASGEGRLPVFEVLLHNTVTAQLVRDGKVHQLEGRLQESQDQSSGMRGLDADLAARVADGSVTLAEAVRVANDADRLREWADERRARQRA